ncbi:Alpha-1,2-mannosyltransferase ALG9, partial [Geodia barretti]
MAVNMKQVAIDSVYYGRPVLAPFIPVPGAGIFIRSRDYRKVVQPMIIWMLIFFTRPHKEERFLFPIYPLFCLSAVVTLHLLPEILTVVLGVARMPRLLRRFFISHL